MANNLDVSNSNSILKNILVIVIVAGIAYLIYYLYNKNNETSNKINYISNNTNNTNNQSSVFKQPPLNSEEEFTNDEASFASINAKITGRPNGLSNPIMNKVNTLPKGNIVGQDNMEHFSNNPEFSVERNLTSFPKDQLTAEELLPQDNSSLWAQVNPSGEGSLKDRNFLQSGYHIGINTVGQTLRNANLQIRSEPPCPQIRVSPWAQSTIQADVSRKPFEIGGCQ
jgi:hypothetical protein